MALRKPQTIRLPTQFSNLHHICPVPSNFLNDRRQRDTYPSLEILQLADQQPQIPVDDGWRERDYAWTGATNDYPLAIIPNLKCH